MDRPNCLECGKPAERHHGDYWRKLCRACRAKKEGGYHYPGGRSSKQSRLSYVYGLDLTICKLCGWKGRCDIHHDDKNRQNDSQENLEVICPNCHRNIHHPL